MDLEFLDHFSGGGGESEAKRNENWMLAEEVWRSGIVVDEGERPVGRLVFRRVGAGQHGEPDNHRATGLGIETISLNKAIEAAGVLHPRWQRLTVARGWACRVEAAQQREPDNFQ